MPNGQKGPNVPFAGRSNAGRITQLVQAFAKKASLPPVAPRSQVVIAATQSAFVLTADSPLVAAAVPGGYRLSIALPSEWTRIVLVAPPSLSSLGAGQAYLLIGDFSAAGVFDDEDCITTLTAQQSGVSIKREESQCLEGQQAWTVQILSSFAPAPYGGGLVFNAPSVKNSGWTGAQTANVPTTWTTQRIV